MCKCTVQESVYWGSASLKAALELRMSHPPPLSWPPYLLTLYGCVWTVEDLLEDDNHERQVAEIPAK